MGDAADSAGRPVSGSFQDVIDADNGPGLFGQTLKADFTCDDAPIPDSMAGGNAAYSSFRQSLTVMIGSNAWHWSAAHGRAFLAVDNDVGLSFVTGPEDRVNVFAENFAGPNLVAEPVAPEACLCFLHLSDNTPTGTPDGVSAEAPLPSTAPDPDDFDSPASNPMVFAFHVGDPETGSRNVVATSNVTAVPEPATSACPVAGLTAVMGMVRRFARRRSLSEPPERRTTLGSPDRPGRDASMGIVSVE